MGDKPVGKALLVRTFTTDHPRPNQASMVYSGGREPTSRPMAVPCLVDEGSWRIVGFVDSRPDFWLDMYSGLAALGDWRRIGPREVFASTSNQLGPGRDSGDRRNWTPLGVL